MLQIWNIIRDVFVSVWQFVMAYWWAFLALAVVTAIVIAWRNHGKPER